MNYENIALLHLMNQDTKELSLEELCKLYENTIKDVEQAYRGYQKEKYGPNFSIE